jgi:hypothetical protein
MAEDLVSNYKAKHQHPVNRLLHTIGIPTIVISSRLGATVRWSRDRRKSTCLLQEPCLSLRWTNVVVAAGRILRWLEQSETFKVAVD